MFSLHKKLVIPTPEEALPGREEKISVASAHFVNGHPLQEPFPEQLSKAVFGLGCFWGAERKFWQQPGVYSSAVGYSAGHTKNPSYQEVCSGMTGHNEVVLVVYDEDICSYEQLVRLFFESHNPTQGMQQGNDQGTQYRSGIYYFTDEQKQIAHLVSTKYQKKLTANGLGTMTTEILQQGPFYYAEDCHQQYLAKNPNGYCGLGGTGIHFDD